MEGEFTRGLYASLTLETTKRNKYANEILKLRTKISTTEEEFRKTERALTEVRTKHTMFAKEIGDLEQYIGKRTKQIESLSADYLTLDEAHAKLDEIKKEKQKKL